MYVKHLQEYLDKFTEGRNGMRGNAVSDAKIYIMTRKGYLEEIKRIEVHESNNPNDPSIRVVLKQNREEKNYSQAQVISRSHCCRCVSYGTPGNTKSFRSTRGRVGYFED